MTTTPTPHTFTWAYRHTPTGELRPLRAGAGGLNLTGTGR